jgi:tryptophan halogenase
VYNKDINTLDEIKADVKNVFKEYNFIPSDTTNQLEFKNFYRKANHTNRECYNGTCSFFFEPLEATSIMTTILSLSEFTPNTLGNILKDQYYIDRYNKHVVNLNDNTFDFIFLHYLTKREDTDFWKSFKDRPMPEAIQQFLEECKHTIPNSRFFSKISSVYESASWLPVSKGLRILNKEKAAEMYSGILSDIRREEIPKLVTSFYINLEINLDTLADHSLLLKRIRES